MVECVTIAVVYLVCSVRHASRNMCTIYVGIVGTSSYVVELVFILMAAIGITEL